MTIIKDTTPTPTVAAVLKKSTDGNKERVFSVQCSVNVIAQWGLRMT